MFQILFFFYPVDSNEPKYIAFISGLEIGNEAYNSLKTQLLFEYLTGELGCFAVSIFIMFNILFVVFI